MNKVMSKYGGNPLFVRDRPLIEATFLERPNRFIAIVCIDGERGKEVQAHVADPGRLTELLIPGVKVYLLPAGDAGSKPGKAKNAKHTKRSQHQRKTAYTLVLVDYEGILVSIDSRVPNELVYDGLKKGFFPEFRAYDSIKREAGFGDSRLDFRLSANSENLPDCLIEVKSASLVRDGHALFPDAPTIRGARHMRELRDAVSAGLKASVIFVIQREDAKSFSPNDAIDPKFGSALREAVECGVNVLAYTCRISGGSITLNRQVDVVF